MGQLLVHAKVGWMGSKKRKPKADPDVSAMGERLRRAREMAGVSIVTLADASSVDQPAISRFESGERGLRVARLLRLLTGAAAVGIDVNDVLGGPLVVTDDAALGEKLVALGLQLKNRQPHKLPAPSNERKKP